MPRTAVRPKFETEGDSRPASICSDDENDIEQSLVSAESAQSRPQTFLRHAWLMTRMQWINYCQILFDQLEHQYAADTMPYVCLQNFVNALVKIQPLMPLTEQPESKEKTLRFS